MCQLRTLNMNKLRTSCGQHATGTFHTAPVDRIRAGHVCSAVLNQHQQPQAAWQVLQQMQAALYNRRHQLSAATLQQQQQQQRLGALLALPCLPAGSKRSYSKAWRQPAAARDSSAEPSLAGVVTTFDEQQQQTAGSGSSPSQQQQDSESTSGSSSVDMNASSMIQPQTKPLYSPLHYDILEFVQQVAPTPAERAEKQRVIQCVAAATKRSFEDTSHIRVQPFGSFVNGLSTWNSDVDLVVTGLAKPSRITGGFSQNDKRLVYRTLDKIAANLRKHTKLSIKKMITIRTARIPIIKLETTSRVVADISMGDTSGPRAAKYIAQQVAAYPPLAPLVMVLKVYLRSCGLNEVMNGGISSFSLTNMVLAYLMEELRDGHDVFDLGETLYGFLCRFGDQFNVNYDAVSVALGGCVPRTELSHLDTSGPGQPRLILEDPLTGRDVASGSYRIVAVQMALSKAARRLESLAQRGNSSGTHINYLEGLFDVRSALDRSGSKRSSWAPPGAQTGLVDEYFVLGQGGRFVDMSQEEHIDIPLEGDDYSDELETYLEKAHSHQDDDRPKRRRRKP